MITMIGLAVGIDYSLFIVERTGRSAAVARRSSTRSTSRAGRPAGRSLFSGMTVVLALLGMFLVPTTIFRSLGIGAILVVIVAVVGHDDADPGPARLLGDQIDWPRKRKYDAASAASRRPDDHETIHTGFWGRITRVVMARPVVSARRWRSVCCSRRRSRTST